MLRATSQPLTTEQLLSLPSTPWINRLPKTAAGTPDLRFDPIIGPLLKTAADGSISLDLQMDAGAGQAALEWLKKYSTALYMGAAALFVLALMRSRR